MKKIIAAEPDKVVVAEVAMPEAQPDEVLVKGVRSLLSPGSELKRVRRSTAHAKNVWPNHDLGYAMAGIVAEVGDDVENLQVGDRVVTMKNHQQFVASRASMEDSFPAIPLPDDIDWDIAPFVVWGRSCANWQRRADIQAGENVAVVGCGLVGLLMTMWARMMNPAAVICTDLFESRLELAKKAGADVVLNAQESDVAAKVTEVTDGGADVTLHCVAGAAVKSFEDSQRMTRGGGRVVLIGHHTENCTILPYQFTGKDLLGAGIGYDYNTRLFLDGVKLIESGRLPVRDIVTHKVAYTQAPEIYEMLINNPQCAGAILLDWEEK